MLLTATIKSSERTQSKAGKMYWKIETMAGEKFSSWDETVGLTCQQNLNKTVELDVMEKKTATGTFYNIMAVKATNPDAEFKAGLETQKVKETTKEESIARAVALKAAVDLHKAPATEEAILATAECFLAWLSGESVKPTETNNTPF